MAGVASADDVNLALRHLLRRLLHTPTVRARELAALGRQDDYTGLQSCGYQSEFVTVGIGIVSRMVIASVPP